MKTDSIFYQLFKTLPKSFFDLIGQPNTDTTSYEFASVEVKAFNFRIDGVFLPKTINTQQRIYFTEVQFQRDPDIYWRFVTESFLYLGQAKRNQDWQAVLLFAKHSLDPGVPLEYDHLVTNQKLRVLYLNQFETSKPSSLGVGIVQLVLDSDETAVANAQQLVQEVGRELTDEALKRRVIGLIQSIVVYKFPHKSRQEIEAMFGLSDLRQTKVYQEVREEARLEGKLEGKLEAIPRLLAMGLSLEQVAQALDLEMDVVRQTTQDSTAE